MGFPRLETAVLPKGLLSDVSRKKQRLSGVQNTAREGFFLTSQRRSKERKINLCFRQI